MADKRAAAASSVSIAPKLKASTGKSSGLSLAALVMGLLHFRNQLKLYHWQTAGYGAHKALDDAVTTLDGHTDKLLETAFPLDRKGVKTLASAAPRKGYADWTSRRATVAAVNAQIDALKAAKAAYKGTSLDPLVYILEEIIGDLLQTVYLLKFNGKK